ncbi:MAG: YcgJ family protein [Rhodobacterales bacterium]|nr:YcgJ family protein [Rhodobacterales bacterium]
MTHSSLLSSAAAVLLGLMAATSASADQVEYANGVFSPEPGVVCDREGNWCADGTGLSASWTETYMGAEAAHDIAEAAQGEFTFSGDIHCVISDATCMNMDGSVATDIQTQLFGG